MATHDANRRLFLHQLLMSGYTLAATAFIAACSKGDNGSSRAAGLQPAEQNSPQPPAKDSSANSKAIGAGTKVSQQAANYQDEPKGNRSCANCLHFMPDTASCELVEGQISPHGWCILWVEKT